jgi:TetR/AcrR family transcriptional regulator
VTAKERLLRAAVQVFSEKGFSGASTREIARRARVNPVTLFRTFNSKEQLHAGAVDYLIGRLAIRKEIDALARRNYPAPKFIAGVIKTLVDALLNAPEVQRLILFSALERRDVAFNAVWNRLMPILERVSVHISEYVAKGELRKNDPLITARLILAAAVFHCEMYELYGAKKVPEFNQADLSASYADILYCGLRP